MSTGVEQTEIQDPKEILELIKQKIADLITIKGDPEAMRFGIKDLQRALLKNPSACALMLPEDIGEGVKLIRYYTGKEAVDEVARKAVSKKAPKMDASVIADIPIEDF